MVGMALTPGSLPSVPENGPTCEDNSVVGRSSPTPNDISELGNPLIDAGFQCTAPIASTGQPAATPPIDSLIGPTPRKAIPWPSAGRARASSATMTTATPRRGRLRRVETS